MDNRHRVKSRALYPWLGLVSANVLANVLARNFRRLLIFNLQIKKATPLSRPMQNMPCSAKNDKN
jgi:hypothetical protein